MTQTNGKLISFFRENGYVIVKNAVPKEMCEKTVQAILEFAGKSLNNPEGWYTPPEGMNHFWEDQSGGFVPFHHHQTLWDNRQYPKVYEAFAELLGEEKLWISVDRVNMKPPRRDSRPELIESFIHWDMDTAGLTFPQPCPTTLQGVLYLADTTAEQGGFQCVPSIYRNLEEWIKTQPADRDPRHPNTEGQAIVPIPGEAGDLVIWDMLLPHGNGHNYTDKPRFAQYMTMCPANPDNTDAVSQRIDSWQRNSCPYKEFPSDPRGWEENNNNGPASLTPLGRKLLGVDSW